MTATTVGNNLNESLWIKEISYSSSGAQNDGSSGLSLSFSLTVIVGRAVLQAEYSADANITNFTYTLSSAQYDIHSFGTFPYDGWRIGIQLETSFNVTFDPRPKYCLVQSPNYYANYTAITSSGQDIHTLQLEILHPNSFPNYVLAVFVTPIILLISLAVVCVWITLEKRKNLGPFYGSLVAVCSAVIVFVPIFQLSTQELKTPLTFTWFDVTFLALLVVYVLLLCGLLYGKLHQVNTLKKENKERGTIEYAV